MIKMKNKTKISQSRNSCIIIPMKKKVEIKTKCLAQIYMTAYFPGLIPLTHKYMAAYFSGLIPLTHKYMTAYFPGLISLTHKYMTGYFLPWHGTGNSIITGIVLWDQTLIPI